MKKKMHIAEKYALDVISKKNTASKYAVLACKRYVNDRENLLEKGWKFDERAAQRVINFFEKILKHYQGVWAGKPFILAPWQQFIIWNLYGFRHADGRRRFTEAAVFVPRKNGKTELVAGLGLYAEGLDGEMGAEVYSTATDRDQAAIAFEKAKHFVNNSPALASKFKVFRNAIVCYDQAATFKPWSSDTGKKDGYNPYFAIVDEYHAHRDNSMVEVIESGLGARTSPIVFKITTAGFNIESPCKKFQDICEAILEGRKKQDQTFAIIYGADPEDDWEKMETWEKANPSYHVIETLPNFLLEAYGKAKNDPNLVNNFKTKNLNIWTRAAAEWVKYSFWQACAEPYAATDLHKQTCYGGLDLSDSFDISSFCLYFPESRRFLWWYFVPEEKIKENRADDVDYLEWLNEGWLIVTPGNVIDYSAIRRVISGYYIADGSEKYDTNCIVEQFDFRSFGFDPWNAKQLVIQLTETDGVSGNQFRQGYATMSTPTKQFKKEIYGGEIKQNNNPVTNWMIGNCVEVTDPAGNIKLTKQKSKNKIDGVIAAIIARGEALHFETNESYTVRIIK